MRKLLIMMAVLPILGYGQKDNGKSSGKSSDIGFKGGINFANISGTSSFKGSNRTGFMVSGFFSSGMGKIITRRTEFTFSKQGYNYQDNTNTGTVDLNYIMMGQMFGVRITKYAQIQVGMQTGYLLNAKNDSSTNDANNPYSSMMNMYNRFTYAASGVVELYPFAGIIIGGRYNLGIGDLYKSVASGSGMSVDAKNNVVQLFAGYRFKF